MELIGYISSQPNQEAAVAKNHDSEFLVATISRTRKEIACSYSDQTHNSFSYTSLVYGIDSIQIAP